MSEKPASMYRDIDKPAYTRREYITGIPGSKIAQHQMGDKNADPDDYPVQISLVVEEGARPAGHDARSDGHHGPRADQRQYEGVDYAIRSSWPRSTVMRQGGVILL